MFPAYRWYCCWPRANGRTPPRNSATLRPSEQPTFMETLNTIPNAIKKSHSARVIASQVPLERLSASIARYKFFCVKWIKRSETQTLRAGYIKAEPIFFSLRRRSLPGAREGQNLISWRWSLPLLKNPVWWGSMHAISSYRGNRPTNKHSHKPMDRTDYNTLRRS